MDRMQMIYDLIKEIREEQKDIRQDIAKIEKTNLENHLNWVEHKRNTEALEKIVDRQGIRIEKLEEPKIAEKALDQKKEAIVNKTKMWMGVITAALTLLAAVAKFQGWV